MDNYLLPVGTIVKFKDKKDLYIITGKSLKIDGEFYNYACLKYPEGFNGKQDFIYFNDIELNEIVHLGNINYRV